MFSALRPWDVGDVVGVGVWGVDVYGLVRRRLFWDRYVHGDDECAHLGDGDIHHPVSFPIRDIRVINAASAVLMETLVRSQPLLAHRGGPGAY